MVLHLLIAAFIVGVSWSITPRIVALPRIILNIDFRAGEVGDGVSTTVELGLVSGKILSDTPSAERTSIRQGQGQTYSHEDLDDLLHLIKLILDDGNTLA